MCPFFIIVKMDYTIVGTPLVGIPTINLGKPNLTGLEESSNITVPYFTKILQEYYKIIKSLLQSKKVLTNNSKS